MSTLRVHRAGTVISTTKLRVHRAAGVIVGPTLRVHRAEAVIVSTLLADAGVDEAGIAAFTVVQLNADASSGSPTSWLWEQVSGTPVTISNPTSAHASFVAPARLAATAQDLVFSLVIGNGSFTSAPNLVTKTVLPHSRWAFRGGTLVPANYSEQRWS